jgi:type VI secretion system protein VasI
MGTKKIGGIIAIVLLGLVILGRIALSRSRNGSSTVAASQGAQPASQDKWVVKEDRSPMDDSKTVVLSLDSDDVIQGPLGSSKPTLIVRCKEGKTQVYVSTGMAASVEQDLDGGPVDYHTVRIRLDQADAFAEDWSESTDNKALFASDIVFDQSGGIAAYEGGAAEFAKQLANASMFTFQFTPFDGNTQTARFNVRGLRDHLNNLAEACGWHVE